MKWILVLTCITSIVCIHVRETMIFTLKLTDKFLEPNMAVYLIIGIQLLPCQCTILEWTCFQRSGYSFKKNWTNCFTCVELVIFGAKFHIIFARFSRARETIQSSM